MWLLAHENHYEGVWSPYIVGELVRVRVLMSRRINPDLSEDVLRNRLNGLVNAFASVLENADYQALPPLAGALPDSDDEPILRTALAGQASFVVSLNTRDFPPGNVAFGVRFITPRDFIELLAPAAQATAQDAGRTVP